MKIISCNVTRVVEEHYELELTPDVVAAIEFDINSNLDEDYYPVEVTAEMIEQVIGGDDTIYFADWNRKIVYKNDYDSNLVDEIAREIHYLVREGHYRCVDDYEDYSETTIVEVPDSQVEYFSKNSESEAE